MAVPEMSKAVPAIVSVIFIGLGFSTGTTVGFFYLRSTLDENPNGYWFNMGTYFGFLILPFLVL